MPPRKAEQVKNPPRKSRDEVYAEEARQRKEQQKAEEAEARAMHDRDMEKNTERNLILHLGVALANRQEMSGQEAGAWAADYLKAFRKRMSEPTAQPTPQTDIPPATDAEPREQPEPGNGMDAPGGEG